MTTHPQSPTLENALLHDLNHSYLRIGRMGVVGKAGGHVTFYQCITMYFNTLEEALKVFKVINK